MIYLKAFKISERRIPGTNLYPYNLFAKKDCVWLNFEPITAFYGNNASGKSTLLNIIANKLEMTGAESGVNAYFGAFVRKKMDILLFNQEKYSNGETALQVIEDSIYPDSLYLLDEPEMSLAPQNQVLLAEKLNEAARYLSCQFVVATHSPFMLGTLQGKIVNLDTDAFEESLWTELENVRYFYDFFKKNEKTFQKGSSG
jgi:predicted ATPase